MIRRFGEPPSSARKYVLRPGAYALLPRDGSVLLTVQVDDDWDLQLPGGGIDPGEQPIPALHREVIEETGWLIARPRRLGAFRRFVYMPEYDLWAEKLCHIFVAHPVRQLHAPTEPFHLATWMAPEVAARSLGNQGDRDFMRRYLAGA